MVLGVMKGVESWELSHVSIVVVVARAQCRSLLKLISYIVLDTVTTDVTFPTAVHIAIHGCQGPLAQYCDQGLLDDVIDVCDSLSNIVTQEDGFCSRDHRENRFGLGIPFPHTLIPIGPFSPKEVIVTMTFDDMNYCEAKFSVRLEPSPLASLLGFGAPFLGIGVSFVLFTSYVMGYFQKDRRTVDETTLNEKIFPSFDMMEDRNDRLTGSSEVCNHQAPKRESRKVEHGPRLAINLESRVRLQALS